MNTMQSTTARVSTAVRRSRSEKEEEEGEEVEGVWLVADDEAALSSGRAASSCMR